jgi:hypothetical protein
VNNTLPLTLGEQKLIGKVLKVSTNYRRLKNFIDDNNFIVGTSAQNYYSNVPEFQSNM